MKQHLFLEMIELNMVLIVCSYTRFVILIIFGGLWLYWHVVRPMMQLTIVLHPHDIMQHEILQKQVLKQREENIRPCVVGDAIHHLPINFPKKHIFNVFLKMCKEMLMTRHWGMGNGHFNYCIFYSMATPMEPPEYP